MLEDDIKPNPLPSIYIGFGNGVAPHCDSVVPKLICMSELEQLDWSGEGHWERLVNCWCNRPFAVWCAPAEFLVVVRRDGSRFRLTEHAGWNGRTAGMGAMEFYLNLAREELLGNVR